MIFISCFNFCIFQIVCGEHILILKSGKKRLSIYINFKENNGAETFKMAEE